MWAKIELYAIIIILVGGASFHFIDRAHAVKEGKAQAEAAAVQVALADYKLKQADLDKKAAVADVEDKAAKQADQEKIAELEKAIADEASQPDSNGTKVCPNQPAISRRLRDSLNAIK